MIRATWIAGFWLGALLLSFSLSSYCFYLATQWNGRVAISNVRASSQVTPLGREKQLDVQFHVSGASKCPSWTQHSLYQDLVVGSQPVRRVVPLGITANGLGAPSDKADFDVAFVLPSSVTPGAWYYVATATASCEWFPGLTRQQFQETEPIAVFVSGPMFLTP